MGAGEQEMNVNQTVMKASINPLTYVWHEVHSPLQRQHGNIEAICLWSELEVRMHIDAAHAECVSGQWLHS